MAGIQITIRNFAFGGESYGVLPSGKGCFVRGAVPGERVTVEIVSEHARFVRAKLLSVDTPDPCRIAPECPYADRCPGCAFQHVSSADELRWKQDIFARFMTGCGVEKERILPSVPAPERFGWRNKIHLAVENGAAGYRGEDNVSLVPVSGCLLAVPAINAALREIDLRGRDHVELRYTPRDGVVRLDGNDRDRILRDTLPGFGDFPVPAGAFFQTNPAVAASLTEDAVELIRKSGRDFLTELHCGAGIFSLCAAMRIPGLRTAGAEITSASIACARRAAGSFEVSSRCRFFHRDAAAFYRERKNTSLLLVDPPRSGLDRVLTREIVRRPPEVMIYVSCAPDTLQRDLKNLSACGLQVVSTRLFNMFPCT
ncbi:MAG: class I SAM-dependent RNA methyltransferase, partial [Lentisphaeria bacterium]|nr:class I SAM-dependent RNA methyltransferase [Lentisphaeria bacterium]